MTWAGLPGNLARAREAIAEAQAAAGVSGPVRIIAVTKGHPAEAVAAAHRAGLTEVGENRVQDALAKQEAMASVPVRWHLIGHLQSNKAKLVPGRFAMVHSVDSARIAEALAHAAERAATRLPVLLQVNVAGEEQKSGCAPAEAEALAHQLVAMPALDLKGLMTLAPFTDDERVQRRVFSGLRRLREQLQGGGLELPELSMGMSADFRAAVAEGATIVRLGTILFGERAA